MERINKFVQVVELYKDSANTHKQRMDHQNRGMASVLLRKLEGQASFLQPKSQHLIAVVWIRWVPS
jgi:hypothetical protein